MWAWKALCTQHAPDGCSVPHTLMSRLLLLGVLNGPAWNVCALHDRALSLVRRWGKGSTIPAIACMTQLGPTRHPNQSRRP